MRRKDKASNERKQRVWLSASETAAQEANFELKTPKVEKLRKFKYLGMVLTDEGKWDTEIQNSIVIVKMTSKS